MTETLRAVVARDLGAVVPEAVTTVAEALARRLNGVAVLFYGSVLRTRALDDILDFYVLTDRPHGRILRRLGLRWLWPDVSYHEIDVAGRRIRAKVATMPIDTFMRAASGATIDTTVWIRFAQPCALVWSANSATSARVIDAVTAAIATAARFAAIIGPGRGTPDTYWRALLRETYRTELRVEPPGREAQILSHDPARYDRLLPLAWDAGGIDYVRRGDTLAPRLDFDASRALARAWFIRSASGKALNLARLVKAAFTFDGAARYGLWKVERHTGVRVALTPWRERHPVLAAPGVMWRVLRAS